MIHIQSLIDDAKCFATIRNLRCPHGVQCPHCDSPDITTQGRDDTQPERQRYLSTSCDRRFDDLTDTIFAGHHQPLRMGVLCLYFMGLNLSNAQIAHELDLNQDDAQQMAAQLRHGIVDKKPSPIVRGEVECDEVSIVAGHKGQPDAVEKKGVPDGAADTRRTRGVAIFSGRPSQA